MIGERCRDRLIVFELAFLFIATGAAHIPGNSQHSALKESSWADGHGNYEFYYRTEDSYRYESGTVLRVPGTNKMIAVQGRVEWVAPDGTKQEYEYTADQNGYRTRQIPQNGLMDKDRQERLESDAPVMNYNRPEDDVPVADHDKPQSDGSVMYYDNTEDDEKDWEEYDDEDYDENEELDIGRFLDGPPGDQGIHGSGCSDNLGGSSCTDERGDVMQADQGDRPGGRTPSLRLRLRSGFRRRFRNRKNRITHAIITPD